MKLLIDPNVILDVFCNRLEFVDNASKVFKLCEIKKFDGYICALSIPNIVYIMRKELDSKKIKDILEKLSLIFTIVDLKVEDLKKAANLDVNDYEDAIQCICAKRIKANYIVTRDLKHFANSPVIAIKPSELLERL